VQLPHLASPSPAEREGLAGFDNEDHGHLEAPWTGELLPHRDDFLVVVDTSS
jgi:hypothetical protein